MHSFYKKYHLRITILSIFIFALYTFLVAQFYQIQIIEGEKWVKYGINQHYQTIIEPFKRGTFWSNTTIKKKHPQTKQAFAIDVAVFHLHADCYSIPTKLYPEIIKKLVKIGTITATDSTAIQAELTKFSNSRNRRLIANLGQESAEKIKQWWRKFARRHKIPSNALFFVNDYQRSYPFDKLLGQVLHTIQTKKDEHTSQGIPTGGLEKSLNSYLIGKKGERRLSRSIRNYLGMGELVTPPEHGADVYLTVNHCLQAIAEEELEKGVQQAKAKSGWAVMMNPYTGEILVLAQYPFFPPADYQRYFNDPSLIEHTRVKAVMNSYEHGSVFKPLTLAIGLRANTEAIEIGKSPFFHPEEKIFTQKGNFPGRRKPISDTRVHKFLNMYMALQKSSNIYMGRIVERVLKEYGEGWYRNILADTFQLGKKTGIELPAESPGLLPKIGKKNPNGTLEWSMATPYSLAMGYNLLVNSVQLARTYCAFANGGYLVKPTLVRKIEKTTSDGKKEVILDHTTEEWRASFPKILDDKISSEIMKAMKYTTKRGGTAIRANIPGYTEAGKTSTAHKVLNGIYSNNYFASFIGIAPVSRPEFVLLIAIDEPEKGFIPGVGNNQSGGICAAPIFREITRRSLEYLGVTPDDPYGYPVGDKRYDPKQADWNDEVKQLQDLYEKWQKE